MDGAPATAFVVSAAFLAARAAPATLLLLVAAKEVLSQAPDQATQRQHQSSNFEACKYAR